MNGDIQLFRRILANDLRLFFRSGGGPAHHLGGAVLYVPLLALLHLAAYLMLKMLGAGAEFAMCGAVLLILASAFQRSIETLYNRGDLPLLLASPAPLRVVVATRLVDIAATTLVASGVFLVPVLDCAVLLYGPRWLCGWAALLAGCAVLVPLALTLTLALVGRFGARRARVFVQLLGITIGMVAFGGFQASNFLTRADGSHPLGATGSWLQWFEHAPFSQLAAASRGDPFWLALLVLAGVLSSVWAVHRLAGAFAEGAIAAGADTGGPRRHRDAAPAAWRGAFIRPRWQVVVIKELRLVFRDPLLIARASTQIVTIIPGLAGAFLYRASVGLAGVALVGPALSAALLAALMTTNDEAPDCTAASPFPLRRALAARAFAAALAPALFGLAIGAAVLALGHPFIAAVAASGAVLNALAIAWLTTCTVRPHTPEERARHKQPMIIGQTLYAMLVGGLGAGGVALWVADQPALALGLIATGTTAAGAIFLVRPRRAARSA